MTKGENKMDAQEDVVFDENTPAGKDALAEINFEIVDTGRWLLKVIGGPNNGAEFSMQSSNSYTIGTDPNTCDIVFHDTSVSRQHAKITITDEDILWIEDLKSRNGTLIDGEQLKNKTQLNPNTVISIGTTSFVVYDREGEMQTIISPLLPSIVKTLQRRGSQRRRPWHSQKLRTSRTQAPRRKSGKIIHSSHQRSCRYHHNYRPCRHRRHWGFNSLQKRTCRNDTASRFSKSPS